MPYQVIQEISGEYISKERLILCLYYRGLYKGRIILPWEAFCDPTERLQQTQVLLDFIRMVERFIWWDENPVILGGDFNINLNITEEREAYDQIVDLDLSILIAQLMAVTPAVLTKKAILGVLMLF